MNTSRIRLTRIIAFNWYGFRTIIDVNGLSLLCGETGTGKSVLLDLIQFVMSAGAVKFNKAAAGESNARDLRGYCLCDTNTRHKDGQSRYIRRSGATIAALEFSWPAESGEEPRRETWGIRVQYESPSAQPSFVRFFAPRRMERADMCDAKGALLSEELFRSHVKRELDGDVGFTSHRAFQEEMGVARHLHFDVEQMRKTLPKAIAFELESNYQKFIREFILEPNPPDVTNTRISLGELRQAEVRVKQLYDQQERLGCIAEENRQYQTAFREEAIFGHLRYELDHAETIEKHTGVNAELEALRNRHAENLRAMELAVATQTTAKKGLDDVKLIADKETPNFSEYERLHREEEELAEEVAQLTAKAKTARAFVSGRALEWEKWMRYAASIGWKVEVESAKINALRDTEVGRALDGVAPLIAEFHRIWNETKERLVPKSTDITTLKDKQSRIQNQLDQLKAGRTAAAPLHDKLSSRS